MGQIFSCCTVAEKEAYCPSPQATIIGEYYPIEIEQPWKEKIKTKFSTVDPKFKVVHIPGQGQLRRFPNMDLTF